MISSIAEEYRANAKQCLAWAEQATDTKTRKAFFELAATWSAAALRIEQQSAASYNPDGPSPSAMALTVDLA